MGTIKDFGKLCKMTQFKLKNHLKSELKGFDYQVIDENGYLYAKGNIPILLTAHMDTVHKKTCRRYDIVEINGSLAMSSKDGIGGDDRCGIYIILRILERGYRPSILFCEDEEIGGVGSDKFCKSKKYLDELKQMNYLIELDRANADDAVFYQCGNQEFIKFILETTGFSKDYGTFSDISNLSPMCDVASVNLSCGYYNAHTLEEYVVLSEMENTINVVEKLLNTESKQFDYQKEEPTSYYTDYYGGYLNYYKQKYGNYDKEEVMEGLEVSFVDEEEIYRTSAYWGSTLEYCLGEFMLDHPSLSLNDIEYYEVIYW